MTTREALDAVYRAERARVLATLLRLARDFELAEEALHDAAASAIEAWEREGVPDNPGAWLTTVARRKLLDRLRARKPSPLAEDAPAFSPPHEARNETMSDDPLRLVFTCCHPALAAESQVALTLNAVVGLTAAEIARAFLIGEETLAQRLVRAKRKIRDAAIRYEVPPVAERAGRLDAVLEVVYLVFNEGHVATRGGELARFDLCEEALRLCASLVDAMPDEPEVHGLFALLAFQHARRAARTSESGALVTLDRQDRSRYDKDAITRGLDALSRAAKLGKPGRFQFEAAIAAEHTVPRDARETNWRRIVTLYDRLLGHVDSPVVALNRAVALAGVEGARAGLRAAEEAGAGGGLDDYPYFHAVRGDLLERIGETVAAREAFARAATLTANAVERRHLLDRADSAEHRG